MDQQVLRTELARSLYNERQKKGITQEQLAQLTSLNRTSITNIEGGRQLVSLTALYEIAEALDVDVADLLPTRTRLRERLKQMTSIPDGLDIAAKAEIANWIDSVTIESE